MRRLFTISILLLPLYAIAAPKPDFQLVDPATKASLGLRVDPQISSERRVFMESLSGPTAIRLASCLQQQTKLGKGVPQQLTIILDLGRKTALSVAPRRSAAVVSCFSAWIKTVSVNRLRSRSVVLSLAFGNGYHLDPTLSPGPSGPINPLLKPNPNPSTKPNTQTARNSPLPDRPKQSPTLQPLSGDPEKIRLTISLSRYLGPQKPKMASALQSRSAALKLCAARWMRRPRAQLIFEFSQPGKNAQLLIDTRRNSDSDLFSMCAKRSLFAVRKSVVGVRGFYLTLRFRRLQ